jgi:hypothetical protein
MEDARQGIDEAVETQRAQPRQQTVSSPQLEGGPEGGRSGGRRMGREGSAHIPLRARARVRVRARAELEPLPRRLRTPSPSP